MFLTDLFTKFQIAGYCTKDLLRILRGQHPTCRITRVSSDIFIIKNSETKKDTTLKCVREYYTPIENNGKKISLKNKTASSKCFETAKAFGFAPDDCNCVNCHIKCITEVKKDSPSIMRII